MTLIDFKERQNSSADPQLQRTYVQFSDLIGELKKKELPDQIIESINQDITELNTTVLEGKALRKLIRNKQTAMIKLLEKELKIVPQNYYRNLWLALGMSAFGLPIGVAFGVSMKNMGLLAIGLPIGMVIGMAVGAGMDKKALKEGRQLNIDIKQ